MKFTKEFLEEDLSSKDTVRDEIVAHKRWTVVHRITFQHEGKFYQTAEEVEIKDERTFVGGIK